MYQTASKHLNPRKAHSARIRSHQQSLTSRSNSVLSAGISQIGCKKTAQAVYTGIRTCPRKLPSELFAVVEYLIAFNSSTRSLYGYDSPFAGTIAWIETISVIEPNQDLRNYFKGAHPVNASFAAQTCAIGICTAIYQLEEYTFGYYGHYQGEIQLLQGPRWTNESHRVPLRGTYSSYTPSVDPSTGGYGFANGDPLDQVTVQKGNGGIIAG